MHEGVTFLRDFDGFRADAAGASASRRPTGVPPSPPTVLTVDRLGYRYPGATDDALHDVSFELRRGQIMAIVGANGSGKIDAGQAAVRPAPAGRGAVAWDGVDLARCDPALVRAQIAPVFQDFARYMLTIRQAIGLGDAVAPRRRGAASGGRRAGRGRRADRPPRRTASTPASARCSPAAPTSRSGSGSGWRSPGRCSATRPIVVLDEPSASLDPRAEADLFDLLHSLCDDRIVIFVSHRFATVRSADVVLVLDQGDVVEMGSHDELMAPGGLYHDLFKLQAERYGLRTDGVHSRERPTAPAPCGAGAVVEHRTISSEPRQPSPPPPSASLQPTVADAEEAVERPPPGPLREVRDRAELDDGGGLVRLSMCILLDSCSLRRRRTVTGGHSADHRPPRQPAKFCNRQLAARNLGRRDPCTDVASPARPAAAAPPVERVRLVGRARSARSSSASTSSVSTPSRPTLAANSRVWAAM